MIPADGIVEDFEVVEEPTYTYYLDYEKNRITGYADELEAVKQAIYKLLNTEKYQYPIYDDYGVEFADLFGKGRYYVLPEIERRITEALLSDERVYSVSDFSFQISGSKYHATFIVQTEFGELEVEKEVRA